MKTTLKITLVVFAFMAIQTVNAQDEKSAAPAAPAKESNVAPAAKHNDMSSWPELKAFHVVMSQTFHPSEEGNLKPIKERSGELNTKAIALEKSKIPAEFNTPEIKAATKELSTKTAHLNDIITKKADDEKIKTVLAEAHDSFHKIVGLCKPGSEHHDERKQPTE